MLTVITVCYNVVNEIEDTIKSVVSFCNQDIEYVIVDGGSTDGTLSIIKKYANSNIKWVSERDNGIYDAMNKGLKMALGQWAIFINCGDKLLNIPQILYAEDAMNYSCVCGAIKTETGEIIRPSIGSKIRYKNTIPHQGLFYNLQKDIFSFDTKYKIYADYELNIRAYKQNMNFKIIDDIIALHSLNGLSSNPQYRNESFKVTYDHFGFWALCIKWGLCQWGRIQGFVKRKRNQVCVR